MSDLCRDLEEKMVLDISGFALSVFGCHNVYTARVPAVEAAVSGAISMKTESINTGKR